MKRMKRPDGAVVEEFITSSWHVFEDGKLVFRDHDPSDGGYTGRFCFKYKNGKYTPWYTEKTAPKWLAELYEEARTT
jgi:hypothetical protein